MTTGRRRDWFRILRDLMAAGVSMHAVARKCNRDHSTVAGWANGAEPRESDGRLVLAMYARYCPELYTVHQRQFEIRIEIENLADPGETLALPFVG